MFDVPFFSPVRKKAGAAEGGGGAGFLSPE